MNNSSYTHLMVVRGPRFANKVKNYMHMMGDINVITLSLKSRGHTLVLFHHDLNLLISSVCKNGENPDAPLFQSGWVQIIFDMMLA